MAKISRRRCPVPSFATFILPLITQAANDPQLVLDLDFGRNNASWNHPKVIEALTKADQLIKQGAQGVVLIYLSVNRRQCHPAKSQWADLEAVAELY